MKLQIERIIDADVKFLFEAWTRPELLMQWWGPEGVTCTEAKIEPRVGGIIRISHRLPDGRIGVISGVYERITAPHFLEFTWQYSLQVEDSQERVEVSFESMDEGTKVLIVHHKIPNKETLSGHDIGWNGCLDGLQRMARD
jgi:uncharacterized protein YndB with AHSA1/START domain